MSVQTAMSQTAVVIRSYRNQHVVGRVKTYLKMGVGRVIVVVKAHEDQGQTRAWLASIGSDKLHILEMYDGYHWSTALNHAARAVITSNLFKKPEESMKYIFNASVEALFNKVQLLQIVEEAEKDEKVAVVGTTFEGLMHGNEHKLGSTYRHPRNTGMLCRVEALSSTNLFNSACDQMGGMEDIDFLLALKVQNDDQREPRWCISLMHLGVLLILGKNWVQDSKEEREQKAMAKIIANWRNICPVGGPEIARVNQVVVTMRLEEE